MKGKYTIDTLIGKTCGHGSPGYLSPEVIEAIFPYTGKPLNGVDNQELELWGIDFESGCFTYMKDENFQALLKEGEVSYKRAAGFNAFEAIEVFDQPDDARDDFDTIGN